MNNTQPDHIDVITEITVANNATDKERVYKAAEGKQISFKYHDNMVLIVNEYPDDDSAQWIGLARFLDHSVVDIKFKKIKNPNAGKPINTAK